MRLRAILFTSALALSLAACGEQEMAPQTGDMPQPRAEQEGQSSEPGTIVGGTPVHAAEATGHADVGELLDAPFMLDFTEGAGPQPLRVSEGLSWQTNGEGYVLSGELEDTPPSDGFAGGVVFEIPAGIAAQLSTRPIEVVIVASAQGGAEFAVAYSTNDGADSGWQSFEVDETPDHVRFEWTIPTAEAGSGDYIGLVPSGGTPVTIHAIAVRARD